MVKLAIMILLVLAGITAAHDPLVPDTLWADEGANSEGHIRRGGGSFFFVRGQAVGSNAYASNITTGSDRAVYYYGGASADTISRYYIKFDTLNGTFKSNFSSSFRIDSTVWSVVMDGNIDSAQCGDTVFVIPRIDKPTTNLSLSNAAYKTVLNGVVSTGFDTTVYVAMKKGNSRISVTMPDRWTDSLDTWVRKSSGAYWSALCMMSCADFHLDSVGWSGTDNYLESMSMWHDEVTTAYNRPYLLVYWTDLGTGSGGVGGWGQGWGGWRRYGW